MIEIIENRKKFFDSTHFRQEKFSLLKKHVPESFIKIISILLEENPENRYRDTFDLKKNIEKCRVEVSESFSILKDSYGRCSTNNKNFGIELYQEFIKESEEAKKRFENYSDFEEQSIIFRSAMNRIIESIPGEEEYIDYILLHQNQHHLSINYYVAFFEKLKKKLELYDFNWNSEIEKAWDEKCSIVLDVIRKKGVPETIYQKVNK